MLVGTRGGFGQYALHILPIAYDSTVSDITMLKYSDSVETHPFGARQYNLLYKGDSTKMAVQVNAGIYMFHKRYTITEYYKNGNKKCVIYYNKHYTKYWSFYYHSDASPLSKGKWNGDKKRGKWLYFDLDGKKELKEVYTKDGTLKSSKAFTPHKKSATTIFNPKHPQGAPYVIQ